jgi:hypothetical protein
MQPHPLTPVMQFILTGCAMCVAVATLVFAVSNAMQQRNAALVSIGVAVLKADPAKEPQVTAAREWALDLIDANAGGVKFSRDAREQLLTKPLGLGYYTDYIEYFSPLAPTNKPPSK